MKNVHLIITFSYTDILNIRLYVKVYSEFLSVKHSHDAIKSVMQNKVLNKIYFYTFYNLNLILNFKFTI